MEDPGIGEPYRDITVLGDEHIAERFGYVGVNVAGTPALIALPETAAPIGAEIVVSAAVKSANGIRVTVDVEADWKTPSWWSGFTGARLSTPSGFWRRRRSSQSD